jgi:hypothetical protein
MSSTWEASMTEFSRAKPTVGRTLDAVGVTGRIGGDGGESGGGAGVSSSVVETKALVRVGEKVSEGRGGSVGDNSIRVAVVVVRRVGQSWLVSKAVVIVEVGDPRGVFKQEVSSRVRCLRMPVGVVGLGPMGFRGLLVFGIMGKCRRAARGKKNDCRDETEVYRGEYQIRCRKFSKLSQSSRK